MARRLFGLWRGRQALQGVLLAAACCVSAADPLPHYELLVLSEDWNPSSSGDCWQGGGHNCSGMPPIGAFTIYGLGPANGSAATAEERAGFSKECAGDPFDLNQVPAALLDELRCIFASSEGSDEQLWEQLWNKSGQCTGLSIFNFFSYLAQQYINYNVNNVLSSSGFSAPHIDGGHLLTALHRRWGVRPWLMCRGTNDNGNSMPTRELLWVSICFPKPNFRNTSIGLGTIGTPIDCPSSWASDSRPGQGGAECNGTLFIRPGQQPPPSCSSFFGALLPGAVAVDDSSGGLSAGAVAGIVVAAVVATAALVLVLWQRRRRDSVVHSSRAGEEAEDSLKLELGPSTAIQLSNGRAARHAGDSGEQPADDAVLSYLCSLSGHRRHGIAEGQSGHGVQSEDSLAASSWRRISSAGSHLWEIPYEEIRLRRQVGEGAFGRVFLGEWNATLVAVKLLLEHSRLLDAGSLAAAVAAPNPVLMRLREEADLMFSLRHPNCVQLMGVCQVPPCLVTEYCLRGSLDRCLREARRSPEAAAQLSWRRRLGLALDAAKGMLYLHSRSPPIMHRDLKSPNLLIDKDWNCKVGDFNLSKYVGEAVASQGEEATNPRWLAPEVLQGQPATPASDAFGFGVVLWELLTWQLPWHTGSKADSHWQVLLAVTSGQRLRIPPPEELPGPDPASPELLGAYLTLVRQCWEQDPAARPTFRDIAEQLREMLRLLLHGVRGAASSEQQMQPACHTPS